MKTNPYVLFIIIFSFTLASCNLGVPAPQDGNALATAAALTVEAALTSAARSPSNDITETPAPLATPTSAVACEDKTEITTWTRNNITYDAKELENTIAPGKSFVMTWVIKNSGSCVWDDTYTFTFTSGTSLNAQGTLPVMPHGYHIQPGESLALNVQWTAPTTPGNYESAYSLMDGQGNAVLNVGIVTKVGAPSSGKLPAPGDLRYAYDCSGGITRISLTWVDKADNEDGYHIYRDGEKLTDLPAGTTTYDDIAPAPGSYQYTVAAFNTSGESPTKVQAETSNCQ